MNVIDKNRVQLIQGADGPTHAVVPYDLWTAIEAALDTAPGDEAAVSDEDLLAGADASGETFPLEVVKQLADGVHPVKVYRKYRGLTQAQLAERIGTTPSYISQIEGGRAAGRATLDLLSRALGVDMDDLVPWDMADGDRPRITIHRGPEWREDREVVSFLGAWGADGMSYFWVTGEALTNLQGRNAMNRDAALSAFDAYRDRILDACGDAVAESREKNAATAIVITTEDFEDGDDD